MREEFAKHREVYRLSFRLAADRLNHRMQFVHHQSMGLRRRARRLKRDSSRTKSSKRRDAAASSRRVKRKAALAAVAHKNSARCARSPRSLNVRMRSFML